MAKVTIGETEYEVTLPNFKKLKAAWRFISVVQASADPMDSVDGILGLISVGAAPAVTVDQLEEDLTPAQMQSLRPFINDLMVEIGLAAKPGESEPAKVEPASPSTATSDA